MAKNEVTDGSTDDGLLSVVLGECGANRVQLMPQKAICYGG
jgi:hypothetical protein